ncbi:MAG TPA: hypothetical protein VFU73_12245 [Actinocrinis sp.]|nr:hypothetical protein [Actinocrinis sp.]
MEVTEGHGRPADTERARGAAGEHAADGGREGAAAGITGLHKEVHTAYLEELGPAERAALMSWTGFTTTFAAVRAITYSIRSGKGPFRNISAGNTHLHHYLWGIAMLGGVGAVAVHGTDESRRHPAVALGYGTGLALIVDEFALLLDLKDVYWAQQGRVSVDVGVGIVAAGGTLFAALPILQRLARNRGRALRAHALHRTKH